MIPKYRAWDKEKKKILHDSDLDGDMEPLIGLGGVLCQGWNSEGGGGVEANTSELLKRYIFMQFTGLKDKNVWEGDIIEGNLFDSRIPTRGEVVYDVEHTCYASKNLGGLTPLRRIAQIKVIGNVHSNPELLKEVK